MVVVTIVEMVVLTIVEMAVMNTVVAVVTATNVFTVEATAGDIHIVSSVEATATVVEPIIQQLIPRFDWCVTVPS